MSSVCKRMLDWTWVFLIIFILNFISWIWIIVHVFMGYSQRWKLNLKNNHTILLNCLTILSYHMFLRFNKKSVEFLTNMAMNFDIFAAVFLSFLDHELLRLPYNFWCIILICGMCDTSYQEYAFLLICTLKKLTNNSSRWMCIRF